MDDTTQPPASDPSQTPAEPQNQAQPQPHGHPPRERIQSFEQMKVWQEAHALTLRVFEVAARIPVEQREGLAVLMERAAIEIPKCIAEGFKRRGSRNKGHYYNVGQSSLEALRYLLILARDLKHPIDFEDLWNRAEAISRMLEGLVRSMARSSFGGGGGGGGRGDGGGRGEGGGRGDGGGRGRRRGGRDRRRDDIGESSGSRSHDEWGDE